MAQAEFVFVFPVNSGSIRADNVEQIKHFFIFYFVFIYNFLQCPDFSLELIFK